MHVSSCLRLLWLSAIIQTALSISSGPLSTSGRWIVDSNGQNVTYAGVNWPGAAETMLPEGLQYQSISTIVGKIKSLGMNVIRLTFAIELIDDIYNNGADFPIKTALTKALGEQNGTTVYQQIIKNNPQFGSKTTRLQVSSDKWPVRHFLILGYRYLMQSQLNAIIKGSMCIWTIMFPRLSGVAQRPMAMPGLGIRTST